MLFLQNALNYDICEFSIPPNCGIFAKHESWFPRNFPFCESSFPRKYSPSFLIFLPGLCFPDKANQRNSQSCYEKVFKRIRTTLTEYLEQSNTVADTLPRIVQVEKHHLSQLFPNKGICSRSHWGWPHSLILSSPSVHHCSNCLYFGSYSTENNKSVYLMTPRQEHLGLQRTTCTLIRKYQKSVACVQTLQKLVKLA